MNKKKLPLPLAIIICFVVLGCIGIASGFDKDADPGNITTTNPSAIVFGQQNEQTTKTIIDRLPNLSASYDNHILLQQRRNGGCDRLKGTIKPIIIFVNDSSSRWTESDKENYKKVCTAEMQEILQDAAMYGQTLTFDAEYITVTTSYKLENADRGMWIDDILRSAGLQAQGYLNDALEQKYGVDEVPLVFCVNRTIRANANHEHDKEYVLLFDDATGFRHELYHLYGAVDYYYPDAVKNLAKSMFAESIMFTGEIIDDLTAYTIGWTDVPSAKAIDFLDKTAHVTVEDINKAMEKEMYTGYVVDWQLDYGTFTGYLKDGVIEGQGTLNYNNGEKYVGEWKYGAFDGYGTFTYSNGDSYSGGWKKGNFDGNGTYTYSDGDRLVGEWKNGNCEGQVTLTYANGDMYVGGWKNNTFNGYGTYTFSDGQQQSGTWQNGSFVG